VPFWRLRLLLLAVVASASLASCSGGGSLLGAGGGERPAANATDAAFLRSMTKHEEKALGITRLAERRALRLELRGIARKMTTEEDANLRELAALTQGPAGHVVRPPAVRTMSPALADLARVMDATSFDHEFMRTMIEQNQAAISIAHDEVKFGSDPEVKRLAGALALAREKELEQLWTWLHLWYGDDVQRGPGPLKPPGGGGDQQPPPGGGGGQPSPAPPL
jgi:uncharacterized protein (DUF305 family)